MVLEISSRRTKHQVAFARAVLESKPCFPMAEPRRVAMWCLKQPARCLRGLWLTATATSLQPVYEPAWRRDPSYFVHDNWTYCRTVQKVHSDFEVLNVLLFNPALSCVSKPRYLFHMFSNVFFPAETCNNSIVDVVERDQGHGCFTCIPLRPSVGGGAYVGCYGLGSGSGLLPCCELLGEPNSFGVTWPISGIISTLLVKHDMDGYRDALPWFTYQFYKNLKSFHINFHLVW